MNWEAIGAIGEVVGAIAVIVTLLFLSNQIRQSNKLGRAEAERDWFSTWHALVREAMGSEESVELFRSGLNEYSSMTSNQRAVFSTKILALFDHVDVLRRLHEKGYVADDLLAPLMNVLNAIVATPGGSQWWMEIGSMLSISSYFEEHRDPNSVKFTELMPYFKAIEEKADA
jgi:hypothetical protein